MAKQIGFTLVECLMVMVILTLVSAISWPSLMIWTKRTEFKAEVSTLVSSLRRAKMEAIETNSTVVIQVVPGGYTIFTDNSRVPGQAGDGVRQPDERLLANCRLKQGMTISSNFPKNRARFNSRPGMTAGRFILQDSEGRRIDVIVNRVGRVRVEEQKALKQAGSISS